MDEIQHNLFDSYMSQPSDVLLEDICRYILGEIGDPLPNIPLVVFRKVIDMIYVNEEFGFWGGLKLECPFSSADLKMLETLLARSPIYSADVVSNDTLFAFVREFFNCLGKELKENIRNELVESIVVSINSNAEDGIYVESSYLLHEDFMEKICEKEKKKEKYLNQIEKIPLERENKASLLKLKLNQVEELLKNDYEKLRTSYSSGILFKMGLDQFLSFDNVEPITQLQFKLGCAIEEYFSNEVEVEEFGGGKLILEETRYELFKRGNLERKFKILK